MFFPGAFPVAVGAQGACVPCSFDKPQTDIATYRLNWPRGQFSEKGVKKTSKIGGVHKTRNLQSKLQVSNSNRFEGQNDLINK